MGQGGVHILCNRNYIRRSSTAKVVERLAVECQEWKGTLVVLARNDRHTIHVGVYPLVAQENMPSGESVPYPPMGIAIANRGYHCTKSIAGSVADPRRLGNVAQTPALSCSDPLYKTCALHRFVLLVLASCGTPSQRELREHNLL